MARFLPKSISGFHQMTIKISRYNSNIDCFSRIFNRNSSQKSKYKPMKLAYELFEPKSGSNDRLSPLIFLHGITSSKEETWGDLPQAVADRTKRKAYSLDARNHGDSDWSDEFHFDLNAEDLLRFIDETNCSRAVVIGHSLGGITGIKAALKAPERVEMLFAEEIFVKKIPQAYSDDALSYMRFWREAEQSIPAGGSKEEADSLITEYVLRKTRPQDYSPDQESRFDFSYPLRRNPSGRYVFKANLEVVLESMKNLESIMDENEGIYEGPSCFLYATRSPYRVGKEKHHILEHFPKAVFVPFETSKHFVHKECPELFVETVAKFINENGKEMNDASSTIDSRIRPIVGKGSVG